jgi:hypothetical protein
MNAKTTATCGKLVGNWKCQLPTGHAGRHGTKVVETARKVVADGLLGILNGTTTADAVIADLAPVLETKHCKGCSSDLPRSAFSTRSSAKDGLNPLCRTCRGGRRSARRQAKRLAASQAVAS